MERALGAQVYTQAERAARQPSTASGPTNTGGAAVPQGTRLSTARTSAQWQCYTTERSSQVSSICNKNIYNCYLAFLLHICLKNLRNLILPASIKCKLKAIQQKSLPISGTPRGLGECCIINASKITFSVQRMAAFFNAGDRAYTRPHLHLHPHTHTRTHMPNSSVNGWGKK